MAFLKYYEEEQQRHPELHRVPCSPDEAKKAISKLCRHFKVRPLDVKFTSGSRTSHAYGGGIVLNRDGLDWLTVVHEFAHEWHMWDQKKRQEKIRQSPAWRHPDLHSEEARLVSRRFNRIAKEVHHGKRHAKLVDRAGAYAVKKGWTGGVIGQQAQERQQKKAALVHAREAKASSYTARIEKRAAQVARLERKIKALTTRVKKARRSLAALTRAAAKAQVSQ